MYGIRRGCTRLELKQITSCRHRQKALNLTHSSSPAPVLSSTPKSVIKDSTTLSNPKLQNLVKSNFPGSKFCFAYGSKVLHQSENLPTAATMTDLIFVAENPAAWHVENFRKNKHHYSLPMRMIGPNLVALIQDIRPYCFFNPFVEVDGVLLKYGVISENHLLRDLQSWDTLYVAGRLQKPVLVLHQDPKFRGSYIIRNLRSALHTALMFLPERFNDLQLFTVICNISYCGDVRSIWNLENPNKVKNIVEPNIEHFRNLYASVITESPFVERTDYGYCQAAKTEKNLRVMEKLIPSKLLFVPEDGSAPRTRVFKFDERLDTKDQLFRKVAVGDYRYPEEQIKKIIFRPSIVQTFKGLLTAGVAKSFKYSRAKLKKSKVKAKSHDLPVVASEGQLMSNEYNIYRHNMSIKHPQYRNNIIISFLVVVFALFYVAYRQSYYERLKSQV